MRWHQMKHMGLSLCIAVSTIAGTVSAGEPRPEAVHVFPPEVELKTQRDRQSLVVQAVYEDGITRDVSGEAEFQIADEALLNRDGPVLHPAADGKTELRVSYGGRTATVPVTVEEADVDPPVSFKRDVMPVFAKAGCNTGSCHGAARGKDGFRLSLFGFDPEGDYFRLTRELPDRRINLAVPERSLLLEKATGQVPHTGGKRFEEDSELYDTLLRWLQAGAPEDEGEVPEVVEAKLYPPSAVLDGPDAEQQLTVLAEYSDGTTRDVTSLAHFMSNNDNSAVVSQEGVVSAEKRGEAFLMARFGEHTVGSHFIVLPETLDFEWPDPEPYNYIDELVFQKLRKLRVAPSQVCSDEEFLRRVSLDITGRLPTVEEYERFMADDSPNKREELVDELLSRKEFVEMWVMKWAELLQIRTVRNRVSYKAMLRYYEWLERQVAQNVPMDEMVQKLLSASGGTFTNPATNYYENERDTLKTAENVAQVFMGMRIQCAQCHNHPFDRWTMDDYYGFAAFFAQIGRKDSDDPRETIIYNRGGGNVRHPVDNRVMQPKFLGGRKPEINGRDRREVLAEWLASPENPYFAKNLANIVWAHFFGRGIIEPVDDVRVSNPAVNPELLEELGRRFTEYDYDFKELVRDICTSRTYQLSSETNSTNAGDDRNFSHAQLRRLRAEVLLDAITQVTETANKFRGLPRGARAVQIADGNTSTYFLTTFGRASRETVCSCEVEMEPNLSQALHMLNGETVNRKIKRGGVVGTLLENGKTPEEAVEELYLRCLTRKPTEKEMAALKEALDSEEDTQKVLEDVFWALLNSREFLFNH